MSIDSHIIHIHAREILDSRGYPTVEACIRLADGSYACASVPSGASTGSHEAYELRDGDPNRYNGKGVYKAVRSICEIIAPALFGMDASKQPLIDKTLIELDGTSDKSNLGANAILAVSLACARAAAQSHGLPLYRYLGGSQACILPVPMMNVINGGAHSDAPIDIQEIMIVPHGVASFAEALRCGAEIFHCLGEILKSMGLSRSVGDEGGYAPAFKNTEEALDTVVSAIEKAGYHAGREVSIALDIASTEFYDTETHCYHMKKSSGAELNIEELCEYYGRLLLRYPIISIEDPAAEDDWAGWQMIHKRLSSRCQIVGDDIFVTNAGLLRRGIKEQVANAILVKLNQIGTLSEAMEATRIALHNGMGVIISHRSGETEDSFIADLALATQAGQIKTGSLSRSERIAKYNQLLRIEEELGSSAIYGGEKSNNFPL